MPAGLTHVLLYAALPTAVAAAEKALSRTWQREVTPPIPKHQEQCLAKPPLLLLL